jgi:DNA (cytosine-5)-methyltransferase 1
MAAYFNEFDPFAAAWLRELMVDGLIADGEVDTRPIQEVSADDLRGFTQAHFFAGIGGWSAALRLARWPDDKPVWTGSCPCQGFSLAGAGRGFDDPRHLWPVWFSLIRQCAPSVVFGEQVEAAVRHGWLDLVQSDLEREGYAFGAAVLGAHSVGAPHIRQRLWFVADAVRSRRAEWRAGSGPGSLAGSGFGGVADDDERLEIDRQQYARAERAPAERGGAAGDMADAQGRDQRRLREWRSSDVRGELPAGGHSPDSGLVLAAGEQVGFPRRAWIAGDTTGELADPLGGFDQSSGAQPDQRPVSQGDGGNPWADLEWLPCRDGKARPTKPGLQPLAHGVSGRVGLLRGAGNAIVPQVAAEFIGAYLDIGRAA